MITSDIQGMVWGEPEREQLVAVSSVIQNSSHHETVVHVGARKEEK